MPRALGIQSVASNRKAFHDYFVLERYEAGIELAGTEVKSIRAGTLNLKDSFCTVKDGEITEFKNVTENLSDLAVPSNGPAEGGSGGDDAGSGGPEA